MRREILAILAVSSALMAGVPAFASETVTYTYDARGRLVAVTHAGSVNNGVQASYTYDPADNRTNVTVTGGGSGGDGGGGASVPPVYQTRYIYNGRFFVSVVRVN